MVRVEGPDQTKYNQIANLPPEGREALRLTMGFGSEATEQAAAAYLQNLEKIELGKHYSFEQAREIFGPKLSRGELEQLFFSPNPLGIMARSIDEGYSFSLFKPNTADYQALDDLREAADQSCLHDIHKFEEGNIYSTNELEMLYDIWQEWNLDDFLNHSKVAKWEKTTGGYRLIKKLTLKEKGELKAKEQDLLEFIKSNFPDKEFSLPELKALKYGESQKLAESLRQLHAAGFITWRSGGRQTYYLLIKHPTHLNEDRP